MEIDNRIFFAATQSVVQKSIAGMLFVLMLSLLCLTTSGCERLTPQTGDNDIEKTDSNFTLQGTAWKLVGIVDTQTNMLTELEPKNCEKCYTIEFGTDSFYNETSWFNGRVNVEAGWYKIFTGTSTSNILSCWYSIDYNTKTFNVYNIGGTEVCEIDDGNSYRQILLKIQSFTVKDTCPKTLYLYYDDGKNYLLFKPL